MVKYTKAIVALVSTLITAFLIEVGSLIICSLIFKDQPDFYTEYWEGKSAVIIAFILAIIHCLVFLITLITFPFTSESDDDTHKHGLETSLVSVAWIVMIVFAALKWDEIRTETLGKWFAYYIIIGHPCITVIFIIMVVIVMVNIED